MRVLADLNVEGERARLHVRGRGRKIVADARDGRSVRELLRAGPGHSWRRATARRVHAALRRVDLSVELRIRNRTIARAGRDARTTLPARLLGLHGLWLGWHAVWLGLGAALGGRMRRRARG